MRLSGLVAATAASILQLGVSTVHPPAVWAGTSLGQTIFETKCVGCHVGGGNVLSPGKSLRLSSLERDGYSTLDSIVSLTRNGKGQMPKYQGKIPAVSKLSDEELEAVAAYTLAQAKAGWPSS
ncbi:hypothetical protein AB1Y20_011254 [Prymnesium parvum]|uniref:Cytochrome c domain-containing protein n=1 Tax=Prymnesium parvum TaxID=97485 RepID=A0AB34IMD6_PRYPA